MKVDKLVGSTPLPPQVQHLNTPEFYLVGSGMAIAGGATDGKWGFIAGPHYTCSNYIKREEIRLVIDDVAHTINFNMHRARETGIYYGTAIVADITVYLIDSACKGDPYLSRQILIDNKSASKEHNISIKAYITLMPVENGVKDEWAIDSDGNISGVVLCQDTSLFSAWGT